MEALIEEILEREFAAFQKYHVFILIGFTLLIGVIQLIQSIYVSSKIEKIKNDLKKSEIKFSRYNELQISALRTIYHLLVELQITSKILLISNFDKLGHNQLKNLINNWINIFNKCDTEFSKEKILLMEDLKESYSKILGEFSEIKARLIQEKNSLIEFEMMFQGNWNAMYEFEDNEFDEIKKRICEIRKSDLMKNANKNIRILRIQIEEHFKKMN